MFKLISNLGFVGQVVGGDCVQFFHCRPHKRNPQGSWILECWSGDTLRCRFWWLGECPWTS